MQLSAVKEMQIWCITDSKRYYEMKVQYTILHYVNQDETFIFIL